MEKKNGRGPSGYCNIWNDATEYFSKCDKWNEESITEFLNGFDVSDRRRRCVGFVLLLLIHSFIDNTDIETKRSGSISQDTVGYTLDAFLSTGGRWYMYSGE